MIEIVVDGARVQFEPESTWRFMGWDGVLSLAAPDRGLSIDAHAVALPEDLVALAARLAGRPYVADGFEDTPGTLAEAHAVVNADSLSRVTRREGVPLVLASTHGSFAVSPGTPSFGSGTPPPPDSTPVHRGTWRIVEAGQARMRSD